MPAATARCTSAAELHAYLLGLPSAEMQREALRSLSAEERAALRAYGEFVDLATKKELQESSAPAFRPPPRQAAPPAGLEAAASRTQAPPDSLDSRLEKLQRKKEQLLRIRAKETEPAVAVPTSPGQESEPISLSAASACTSTVDEEPSVVTERRLDRGVGGVPPDAGLSPSSGASSFEFPVPGDTDSPELQLQYLDLLEKRKMLLELECKRMELLSLQRQAAEMGLEHDEVDLGEFARSDVTGTDLPGSSEHSDDDELALRAARYGYGLNDSLSDMGDHDDEEDEDDDDAELDVDDADDCVKQLQEAREQLQRLQDAQDELETLRQKHAMMEAEGQLRELERQRELLKAQAAYMRQLNREGDHLYDVLEEEDDDDDEEDLDLDDLDLPSEAESLDLSDYEPTTRSFRPTQGSSRPSWLDSDADFSLPSTAPKARSPLGGLYAASDVSGTPLSERLGSHDYCCRPARSLGERYRAYGLDSPSKELDDEGGSDEEELSPLAERLSGRSPSAPSSCQPTSPSQQQLVFRPRNVHALGRLQSEGSGATAKRGKMRLASYCTSSMKLDINASGIDGQAVRGWLCGHISGPLCLAKLMESVQVGRWTCSRKGKDMSSTMDLYGPARANSYGGALGCMTGGLTSALAADTSVLFGGVLTNSGDTTKGLRAAGRWLLEQTDSAKVGEALVLEDFFDGVNEQQINLTFERQCLETHPHRAQGDLQKYLQTHLFHEILRQWQEIRHRPSHLWLHFGSIDVTFLSDKEVMEEMKKTESEAKASKESEFETEMHSDKLTASAVRLMWLKEMMEAELAEMKSHGAYAALGLLPDCSDAELARAYKNQALVLHPDRMGGSTEAFQALRAAYEQILEQRGGVKANPQKTEKGNEGSKAPPQAAGAAPAASKDSSTAKAKAAKEEETAASNKTAEGEPAAEDSPDVAVKGKHEAEKADDKAETSTEDDAAQKEAPDAEPDQEPKPAEDEAKQAEKVEEEKEKEEKPEPSDDASKSGGGEDKKEEEAREAKTEPAKDAEAEPEKNPHAEDNAESAARPANNQATPVAAEEDSESDDDSSDEDSSGGFGTERISSSCRLTGEKVKETLFAIPAEEISSQADLAMQGACMCSRLAKYASDVAQHGPSMWDELVTLASQCIDLAGHVGSAADMVATRVTDVPKQLLPVLDTVNKMGSNLKPAVAKQVVEGARGMMAAVKDVSQNARDALDQVVKLTKATSDMREALEGRARRGSVTQYTCEAVASLVNTVERIVRETTSQIGATATAVGDAQQLGKNFVLVLEATGVWAEGVEQEKREKAKRAGKDGEASSDSDDEKDGSKDTPEDQRFKRHRLFCKLNEAVAELQLEMRQLVTKTPALIEAVNVGQKRALFGLVVELLESAREAVGKTLRFKEGASDESAELLEGVREKASFVYAAAAWNEVALPSLEARLLRLACLVDGKMLKAELEARLLKPTLENLQAVGCDSLHRTKLSESFAELATALSSVGFLKAPRSQ
eukprot:TRINITY_DN28415_c0_g1_i1.p1 TRINITY_DN28415_c0_g1~~TRINITY_DN28415_c0_g1_i1.p1  ORF type:complete len:1497 (-),score=500.47 TRINITY_DN28415_c0_g1_i1:60-4550(-)